MRNSLVEAVKELLRVVLIAVIPIAVESLSAGELNLRLVAVTGAIAGLRFLDKLLHEYGKDHDNKTLKGGLTRF